MPRYKLIIEYDGRDFVGWQRQDNGTAIQELVEDAIAQFSGESATTIAAGRTDAGVHALGQVIHFDLARQWTPGTVRDALNFHLKPAPVAVLGAEIASADFNARFSARARAYLCRITNRRPPPTLERGRTWWVAVRLDVDAMAEAARLLVGEHDFTTFRAIRCQAKSPVKTLDVLDVRRAGEEIRIAARARSFLHHQIRNLVGTLRLVGEGKWSRADMARALAARDRRAAGPTAPADGLYLVAVRY